MCLFYILRIGLQVKGMMDAVKEAKDAAFFLKQEKPYWWDMRTMAGELLNMSRQVKDAIKMQGEGWVKERVEVAKDTIKHFTQGNMSLVMPFIIP